MSKQSTIDLDPGDVTTMPSEIIASDVINRPGTRFKFTGQIVKAAIRELPPQQHDHIWWFFQHCKLQDFGKEELGRLLSKPGNAGFYSSDSIIQLFGGGRIRRGENIEPIVEAIVQFRRVESARQDLVTSGFIETRLFREIEKRCLKALARQRIAFLFGDSQIGKTRNLQEVQRRHNHGQTIYVEVPTGGSLGDFLRELARILRVPWKTSVSQLKADIIGMFTSRMMLIVDEAHRSLNARLKAGGPPVFDFLRELYNKVGLGIVISMTNEGRDEFLHGRHAKSLQQMWRRRVVPLQLPPVTPDDDLALFATAYNLPEATDQPVSVRVSYIDDSGTERTKTHTESPLRLQSEVNQREGLGVWIMILQDASDIATEAKKPISWGAVIKAHAQSLADGEMLN